MKNLFNSRINKNLFYFHFKNKIILLFLYTLLLLVPFPISLLIQYFQKVSLNPNDIYAMVYIVLALTSILLLISPFIFFSYKNEKKSVDVYHALPIKRNDIFLTLSALSFIYVLIPFLISNLIGYIFAYGLMKINFDPMHIFYFLRHIMVFPAIMSISLFVNINTGTFIDSIIYSIIIIIAPFLSFLSFQTFMSVTVTGFSPSDMYIVNFLSPLAGIFSTFDHVSTNVDGHFIASYWLIFSFMLISYSSYLYSKWKSEYSEQPFSNKHFFPFISSIFVSIVFFFLVSLDFFSFNKARILSIKNLIIPIIITYVIFVFMNIIKTRSVKSTKIASKYYIILLLALISITSITQYTNGFGYAYKLPDLNETTSARISINGDVSFVQGYTDIVVDNPKDIEAVHVLHSNLIHYIQKDRFIFDLKKTSTLRDDLNTYNIVNKSQNNINIVYYNNNNQQLARHYEIPNSLEYLLFPLEKTQSFNKENYPILYYTEATINEINIYDPLMTKMYNIKDNQLEFILNLKKELSRYKDIESDAEIMYTLFYQLSNNSNETNEQFYQINIDSRFKETIKIIESSQEVDVYSDTTQYFYIPKEYDDLLNQKMAFRGKAIKSTSSLYLLYPNNDDLEQLIVHSPKTLEQEKFYTNKLNQVGNDVLLIESIYGNFTYPIKK